MPPTTPKTCPRCGYPVLTAQSTDTTREHVCRNPDCSWREVWVNDRRGWHLSDAGRPDPFNGWSAPPPDANGVPMAGHRARRGRPRGDGTAAA
jgi:hypothetical protein